MNYGNKALDQIRGYGLGVFSKDNFELLFWVFIISSILNLFFANGNYFEFYLGGTIIFFLLHKFF
ncbi:MAG TPA: hypothetical protein QGH92_00895 [Candidatus Parcubacteria bacterium]|jgi:hypothetical protein|nr:hypothetical protein [Candidatus Parcubacteria bacterium]|tara:strand:- start:3126 stop:3320 length:195 start_codon:yes stop_codon:yes gene_type:complete